MSVKILTSAITDMKVVICMGIEEPLPELSHGKHKKTSHQSNQFIVDNDVVLLHVVQLYDEQ